MSVIKGNKEYFKGVGKIKFEGKSSKNPLSYRYYGKNKSDCLLKFTNPCVLMYAIMIIIIFKLIEN